MAKEYNIAKGAVLCCRCETTFDPGQEYVAILREGAESFERRDYCQACWDSQDDADAAGLLAVWRPKAAAQQKKKRLFVDDDVLLQFFCNLEGTEDDEKIAFRFVLTLVLMRKRLLAYEGSRKTDVGAVWTMRRKGSDETFQVTEAEIDEDQTARIRQQLGEILEGEV